MGTITTTDGTEIFYKDWGRASRSCSATGGRCRPMTGTRRCCSSCGTATASIAHDRRGHGRSTQTGDGHDMDHYADDLAALTAHLDLRDAVHVGHSTGGGEVVRYMARHGESRVAKAVLISAVPPLMVQTEANPGGLPKERVRRHSRPNSPRTVALFYRDWQRGRFTVSTVPARSHRRRSSRTGGARE